MAHIDYFFSPVSPFSYLAGQGLEEVAARHGATITYKPLDVLALFTRTGGIAPKDRHESRRAYRLQELRRQAAKRGLPVNPQPRHWPTNPAPASYAIITAQETGGGDLGALAHGLLRACWAEEKDVADEEVVRACLAAAGYDPALASRGMVKAAETYTANMEEAVKRGVFGAPTYAVGEELFWGQDRLEDLDLHLAGKL